jgi:hypothetical protein
VQTDIQFKLQIIDRDTVRIFEELRPNTVEFRAPDILNSEWLEDMLARALVKRFKEIISDHLKGTS